MNISRGFTLIELMVGLSIFLLVAGAAGGLLVKSLTSQQFSLANQDISSQASFLVEYMSRSIRQAQKELGDPPTCVTTGTGHNYMVSGSSLTFVDKDSLCHTFSLVGDQIQETIETGSQFLTTSNVVVNELSFSIIGESQEDNLQPRVKMYVEVEGGNTSDPSIQLQTTISQRRYDVQN